MEAQMSTHQLQGHTLPETWGSADDMLGEKLRLGIGVEKDEAPRLVVEYLPSGRSASGAVELDLDESTQFALSVLYLTARARGCTTDALVADLLASRT
jgi:hypothetical protein